MAFSVSQVSRKIFAEALDRVHQAAEYFFRTGNCAPELTWIEERQVLAKYDL